MVVHHSNCCDRNNYRCNHLSLSSMKLIVPHYVYKEGEKYSLFLTYAPGDKCHMWTLSYVGDHGILTIIKNESLRAAEEKAIAFIKEENLEYD